MVHQVTSKIDRLHVLVIGPGLGRCPMVCEATARIIRYAMTQNLALVLDADALWIIAQPQYRSLLKDYANVVLTPNVVEYKRLFDDKELTDDNNNSQPPHLLKEATVVQKGRFDTISRNGQTLMECHQMGGKKRSGGIGDVLAGTIGTLVAWHDILASSGSKQRDLHQDPADNSLLALSCWTACCFVKVATQLAFERKKRSMTAPDVLDHLGLAIDLMTAEVEQDEPYTNPTLPYGKAQDTSKL